MNTITRIGLFPAIGQGIARILDLHISLFFKLVVFLFGPRRTQAATLDNDRLYFRFTLISVLASMFLAGVSFTGSYTAARVYAANHGIAEIVASWIPVSVDGFILLGITVVFAASLVGDSAGWVRFLILVFTGISVLFNVAHITETQDTTLQHYLLGAIFPVIVFLSAEVASHQIRAYISRRSSLKSNADIAAEIDILTNRRDNLSAEIEKEIEAERIELSATLATIHGQINQAERQLAALKSQAKKAQSETTSADQDHIKGAYLIGQNPNITGKELAEALGRTSATFGNTIKSKIKSHVNGTAQHA